MTRHPRRASRSPTPPSASSLSRAQPQEGGTTTERGLPTRKATKELARDLAGALAPGDLVILAGPLGAGKTFFVRAALRALGLASNERVTSPTFSLVHEIDVGARRILHADLYRVSDPDEVRVLDLEAQREGGAILLVEWGAPYEAELGGDALLVELSLSGGARRVKLSASGPKGRALFDRIHRPA